MVKGWIPPIFLSLVEQLKPYGFYGDYPSWNEALTDSTGYDAPLILQKIKESLTQVKKGKAVYERDSVLFDTIQYSWPLATALFMVAAENGNILESLYPLYADDSST